MADLYDWCVPLEREPELVAGGGASGEPLTAYTGLAIDMVSHC